jgi:HAD superfamily hydrolase (TIGR01509 family)
MTEKPTNQPADASDADDRPPVEPLTPEELEQFLARARAEARLLTPEERERIFGGAQQPPTSAPAAQATVQEMEPARLERSQLDQLAQNFFPELDQLAPQLTSRLVQGVIFDFDDTLAYLAHPLDELMAQGAQAAEAYMRSRGMELPADFWPNIVEARRFSEEKSEEEQEEHLADDALSFLLQFFDYPASKMDPAILHQAVDIFYAPEMSAWRLHPGALEMLRELHGAGYRLALLANHNCDRVFQRTVDYLGIRPYFDLCISSASVEYRKPDVRFFQLALDRWEFLPYEVVVVGDSLRHDIAGGIELGALTIHCPWSTTPQILHDNTQLTGQVTPDAQIDHLSELPALVYHYAQ